MLGEWRGGGGDEALNGQLFARSEKYEQIYTEFLAKLGKCYTIYI